MGLLGNGTDLSCYAVSGPFGGGGTKFEKVVGRWTGEVWVSTGHGSQALVCQLQMDWLMVSGLP